MVSIAESANAVTQGNSDAAGLRTLALDQTLTFTQYTRYVLPLDGYVFWLKTETTQVPGSLHTTMTKRQLEDETFTINRVVFSTAQKVQEFNNISPDKIWVGEWDKIKFAFTVADSVFENANLWHYLGDAVYPALQNMLVDTGGQLLATDVVVSNSLPAWLALKTYSPVWLLPNNPGIPLYPSFLVPENLPPPYGVVHIAETAMLQPTPELRLSSVTPTTYQGHAPEAPDHAWAGLAFRGANHYQLARDKVRVTLYGLTNDRALDLIDVVNDYSLNARAFGIMSATPMRDEKRTQTELGVIAMKKTVEWEVSYYQSRINDVARQLLLQVMATVFPTDF